MQRVTILSLAILLIFPRLASVADEPQPISVPIAPAVGMQEWDHQNLERNLRWMLSRELLLLGMHFERPAPEIGGDEAAVPAIAGKVFRTLLFPAQK
jgi:hypothetical protein